MSRRSPSIPITRKPSAYFAKKLALKAFLFFLAFPLFTGSAAAEAILKVANGRVKEIQTSEQILVLTYRHPVSGRNEELALKVGERTGFPEGVVRLEDFERDEPVTVDYEENPGAFPLALLVKRVPMKGMPKDLAERLR